ncbi:heavy metal translocating P-type ATPase, partial [Halobacteriales archaeon QS_3_64_16]
DLQNEGLTTVGVVREGELIGLVGIGDEIKADASETVDRMKAAGVTPMMITGDNERTAQAVAEDVGVEQVMAEVLPDDKRAEISRLQDESPDEDGNDRVAMVGDGINDAPALTQADIGLAIGAGTDIAIESADIVLMGEQLGGVMDAYEIGVRSYEKTKQNLVAAFSFNGIGVAAAVTGLVHPVLAMVAMALSVSVVLANSFAGRLLSGEGVTTDFSVEAGELDDETGTDAENSTVAAADGGELQSTG